MSALTLKIIACIAMLLDHIGYALRITYPYRIIGRIAFPIYAFLLTEGYQHTKNFKKYLTRLFLFALVSEIPFNLFARGNLMDLGSSINIYFTLSLSLLLLYLLDESRKTFEDKPRQILLSAILVSLFCLIAELFNVDYGFYGILTVLCFRYMKQFKRKNLAILTGHAVVIFTYILSSQNKSWAFVQLYALFALVPILLYNGKKGYSSTNPAVNKIVQYSFYAYYPLHILLIYLLI
ncbi:MAG: hypothetical protein GX166_06860 [Clostridiaceae bacterium]|jgi:hypothetical protein|nr:hypothetical protein [Clostridiaceae bacterium]